MVHLSPKIRMKKLKKIRAAFLDATPTNDDVGKIGCACRKKLDDENGMLEM